MANHKLSLKALRTFERAAVHMSFKDAAENMFITASAVSHQIKSLEEQLGVQLFQRGTRSLTLTVEGELYADYLHEMFDGLDNITDKIKYNSGRPSVSLLLPPFFAMEILLPRLKEFQQMYPDVDIHLESYKRPSESGSSSIDLVVTTVAEPRRGFQSESLLPINLVPACSRSYKEEFPVYGFTDLDKHVLIVNKSRNDAWERLANKLCSRTLRPRSLIKLDSMSEMTRATRSGLGVGMLAKPLAGPAFDSGHLVTLFDSPEYELEELYYLFHKTDNRTSEVVGNFRSWMLDSFQCKDEKNSSPV